MADRQLRFQYSRKCAGRYLLRSVSHVLCVRICAPIEFRETVLMERLNITDRATARREIERNDETHNGTMQRMFGIDWTDPALYAIVLNTARIPVKDCVEYLVRLVQSPAFAKTERSRINLMNQMQPGGPDRPDG